MTRNNLIDQIAEKTQLSKIDSEHVIDTVLTSISEALGKGDKVDLRGFGSFQVSEKKQRQGRNPRTGEALVIAAKKVAGFKPGKELAKLVNSEVRATNEASE